MNPCPKTGLVERLLPYTSHAIGCAIYQRSWVAGEPDCSCGLDALRAEALSLPQPTVDREAIARAFKLGDRVEKVSGSAWHGVVVGFYSTGLTPVGYAVESEREPGSVQIYPEKALRAALLHPIDDISEAKPEGGEV